jgi:SAM-dependent methyltransferase
MPLIPNLLERLLLQTDVLPGPLVDLFAAVGFRAVWAALNLGVFEALERGEALTAGGLAEAVGADERGITYLLGVLQALGYVQEQGGRWTNTAMTRRRMVRGAPKNVVAGFHYWGATLAELWDDLEGSIRSGQPATDLYAWLEQRPYALRDFQEWTIAVARLTGDEIVGKVKLPSTARRLLDAGGGHGVYSIAFCRRYPDLAATIFDLPGAVAVGREIVEAEDMNARVTTQEGDLLRDDLGTGYDVVLLFNIVHGFRPDQNRLLLGKVAAALKPGGQLIIMEQFAGRAPTPMAEAVAQILGLSFYHLLGGQIYPYAEVAGWLTDAGFTTPRRSDLRQAPGSSLVQATRAG